MQCEICGGKAVTKAVVEGVPLDVCANCAGHGTEIKQPHARHVPEISESTINPDFSAMIKQARGKAGIERKALAEKLAVKESVLARIENGMRPDNATARKLEKALGIRLLGFSGDAVVQKQVLAEITLGDVVVIKKKRK
ncbi:MAG: TIGR00270 family protein [Candidatus Aenigmarchaeota archaeon]|nr:TIGR00270 family protein [Candidatus Aenigmarchaeota archaeon]